MGFLVVIWFQEQEQHMNGYFIDIFQHLNARDGIRSCLPSAEDTNYCHVLHWRKATSYSISCIEMKDHSNEIPIHFLSLRPNYRKYGSNCICWSTYQYMSTHPRQVHNRLGRYIRRNQVSWCRHDHSCLKHIHQHRSRLSRYLRNQQGSLHNYNRGRYLLSAN